MTLPSDFWQLPAIAVVAVIVIGWLLWTQREERRSVSSEWTAERTAYVHFIQELVKQAETDRKTFMSTYQEMVTKSIEAYSMMCHSMEEHEKRAEERFAAHESNAQARNNALLEVCQSLKE